MDYAKEFERLGFGKYELTSKQINGGNRHDLILRPKKQFYKYIEGDLGQLDENTRTTFETYEFPVVEYEIEFGEVTGISFFGNSESNAIVEYTEKYVPTPMAELNEFKVDETSERTARFRLYDDGWRIVD